MYTNRQLGIIFVGIIIFIFYAYLASQAIFHYNIERSQGQIISKHIGADGKHRKSDKKTTKIVEFEVKNKTHVMAPKLRVSMDMVISGPKNYIDPTFILPEEPFPSLSERRTKIGLILN